MRFRLACAQRLLLLMGAAALIGCDANKTPEPTTTRTSALTRTFTTDTDTFINSGFPGNNNGASPSTFTGRAGQGGMMRGLVRFAMPPELQARVTVTGARLTMITRGTGADETTPPTAATASLQALTTSWGEGSGFGDTMAMFTVGQPCGSPGVSPGATWDQPNCAGGTAWAGGAVAGAVSGTASVPAALEATVTWDSASGGGGMLTDVQSSIDEPTTNHGWRIVSSTEGGTTPAAQKFYSSEEVGDKGPRLIIDYTCKAGLETPTCVPPDASDDAGTDGGDAAAGSGGTGGGAAGAGGTGGGAGTIGGAGGGTGGGGGTIGGAGGTGASGGSGTGGSGGAVGTAGAAGGQGGSTGSGGGAAAGRGGVSGTAGGGRGGSNPVGAAGTSGSGSGSGCSCDVAARGGEGGGLAGLFALAGVMLRARSRRSRRRYRDSRCAT